MGTVNVRRLDEEVVRKLIERAAANNRSLEGEVRHILELAVEDDMAQRRKEFRELAARAREGTRGRPQTPAEVLIREDRDHGHRDRF